MSRSHSWISPETHRKEADFGGLLDMHVRICKGIAETKGRNLLRNPGMRMPDEYPDGVA